MVLSTVKPTALVALAFACGTLIAAGSGHARIPEPYHVIYGVASLAGDPPVTGSVITARRAGETVVLASYVFGSDPALGEMFVLRIPLDAVDPRLPGTVRPGEDVQLFLDGELAGVAKIGNWGTFQQLDVDPAQLALPTVSIDDAVVVEGDPGDSRSVVFTISLSEPSEDPVGVNWITDDSNPSATATVGSDYVSDTGAVTINPGDSSANVSISVVSEDLEEADEVFFVKLVSASNAVILDPLGQGTIRDDDTPPTLSVNNVTVTEPQIGSVEAAFRVSLSHAWEADVTFAYGTRAGTASPSADYLSVSGSGLIPQGSLSTTVPVEVLADTADEPDETFFLDLSSPFNATILDGEGQATIVDRAQFLIFVETEKEGIGGVSGLAGSFAVAVSPDGNHVYTAGRAADSLVLFEREPSSGALTFVTRYQDGVDGVDGLDGIEAVWVSRDGKNVYAAGFDDAAVAVFGRDDDDMSAGYGRLTFLEAEVDGANDPSDVGGTVDGLAGASSLAESPDGKHLYVTGFTDHALAVFDRADVSGRLSFREVEKDGVDEPTDGEGNRVDGLMGASGVVVSPDGAHVYATGFSDDAVAVFERETDEANGNFGRLSFRLLLRDGVGGVDGLNGARAIDISPDGSHLYVAGQDDDALAVLSRNSDEGNAGYGALAFLQVLKDGVAGVDGLLGAAAVRVSQDGKFVYATGFLDHAVSAFRRGPSGGAGFGELVRLETKRDGVSGVDGLEGANGLAVSADDGSVYVAAVGEGALTVFARDLQPPSDPTQITSTSHAPGVFSSDRTIDIEWSQAADNVGGAGIQGYSFLFDTVADTLPDTEIDLIHSSDPHRATSTTLSDGVEHYFHLRTCDWSDNCTSTVHLGPYFIDGMPPSVPSGVMSTSHTVGVPDDTNNVISMIWTAANDPGATASGVMGYYYRFDGTSSGSCSPVQYSFVGATTVDSAALADGAWNFHICAADGAGNLSSTVSVGPFLIGDDFASPQVTGIDSISRSRRKPFVPGGPSEAPITQLLLTFNESMQGADDSLSFALVEAGGNGVIDTGSCGTLAGDDIALTIFGAIYDDASRQSTLAVGGGMALGAGTYALFACSVSLSDIVGNPLDGDGDGNGGDDYVTEFDVAVDQLLENPNFDASLDGWFPTTNLPTELTHDDQEDLDAAATSGSAHFVNLTGPGYSMALSQCVDVSFLAPPLDALLLQAWTKIDKSTLGEAELAGTILLFDQPNCFGTELGGTESSTISGDTGGSWKYVEVTKRAPPQSSSALVSLVTLVGPEPDFGFDALVDSVQLNPTDLIFRDGFELGDTSRWGVSTP